jgi:hypothetical protein
MAVKNTTTSDHQRRDRAAGTSKGSARRLVVGLNVIVTMGLALVVVCLLNWFAQRYDYRRDMSRLGAYSLSDRTQRVLDRITSPTRLTAIYTSDEPGKSRDRYLPRIRDLFEEMARRNELLDIEIIRTDDQKRQLEKRIRRTFALQADDHVKALDDAAKLDDELTGTLQNQAALFTQIRGSGAWITRFTSFTNIIENFEAMGKGLKKAREQVAALTEGETLPDYTEAEREITNAHDQVRAVLDESKRWLEEMGRLIDDFEQGRIPLLTELPQRLDEMRLLVLALGEAAGAPGDEMPADPGEALKKFGQAAGELATFLAGESARLEDLADRYPVIVGHPQWSVQVSLLGPLEARMDLPRMMRQEQQQLASIRPQIVTLLKQDLEPNQARVVLERVRNLTHDTQANLKSIADELSKLPADLASVDQQTRDLIGQSSTVQTFADLIKRLDELKTQIDELPEIESGAVGSTLKRDNTIVIEMGDRAKVVSFDDVWPIQYQDFSIPGRVTEPQRSFNGDSAVSAALLPLTEEKPIGAVIMVSFEPSIQPQMYRFAHPYAGDYPAAYYENLRSRLRDAHFEVKTWNLAAEESPPEIDEEGLEPVFLVIPPVEFQVPPFVRQQGMEIASLDEPIKQRLYDAIGEDGRAIFLCHYAPPQSAMMGQFGAGPVSQPKYAYQDYLTETWGIAPRTHWRVLQGIPDPRRPGYFGVSAETYAYMTLNNFSMHPIGKPFRQRRVPMFNICPVEHAEEIPEGVTLADVLTVPPRDDFWGAQNIEDVVRAVLSPESTGSFQKDLDPADGFMDLLPPFPIIVAAQNDKGGRIVVSGNSESTYDGYLNQPIPHRGAKGKISVDPPPLVNADLVVNFAYWVCGREELIAGGPLVTPILEPLEPQVKTTLGLVVTAWAFLALVAGAVVMFVRRK